jgi:hypothetical protein
MYFVLKYIYIYIYILEQLKIDKYECAWKISRSSASLVLTTEAILRGWERLAEQGFLLVEVSCPGEDQQETGSGEHDGRQRLQAPPRQSQAVRHLVKVRPEDVEMMTF